MSTPALTPDAFMAQKTAPPPGELNPDSFMAQQTTRPTASIGPADTGAGAWFRNLQSDMRYGGTSTLPGKIIHTMKGSPEHDSGLYGGTSPATAEFLGGPLIGPGVIGEGASQLSEHPVKGINKIVRGAAQTVAPIVGAAVPGALPGAIVYGGLGKGVQSGLEAAHVDPDYAELGGNLAALAAPVGIPKVGGFLERNAAPIGKAAGIGLGIGEVASGKSPLWLLAGTDRATNLATKGIRGAGSMLQSMTPESGIPRAPALPGPIAAPPVSGLLKAPPVELRPSSAPIDTSPEGLLEANRRVVRDPSTGRMKVQYVTSSGGKVIPNEPSIAAQQAPVSVPPVTVSAQPPTGYTPPIAVAEDAIEAGRRGAPGDITPEVQAVRQAQVDRRIKFGTSDDRMRGVQQNAELASPEVQDQGWQRSNDLSKRKYDQERPPVEERPTAPNAREGNPYAGEPPDFLGARSSQRMQSGAGPVALPNSAIAPAVTLGAPPSAPISAYPPGRPTVFPVESGPPAIRTPQQRLWEDKIAQDEARARTDVEDRARFAAINRDRFPAVATKGELTGQSVKPVTLTKMPPIPDDMTEILKQSVAEARKRKK